MGVKVSKMSHFSIFPIKRNHNNARNDDNYIEDTLSSRAFTLHSLSSISNFETYSYMDGRKFHNTSLYILPSDCIEIKRTNYAHQLYKRYWNGNFSSPIEELLKSSEGGRVLDCG